MRMKGESSKSLGNIGNYEIGARWHWNLQLGTVTVILLAISLVLTSILCAGFIYFWIQFAELARTKANLMEIQQEVLKVQSALNLEIEEIRKLKEDMLLNHISDAVVDREKRSAFLGKGVSAVHLERSNVSFSVTGSNGIITRWYPQFFSESPESIAQLEDQNSSLVIQSTGLYLVYAQLCYAATKENNSFEIRLVNHRGSIDHSKVIAQCSAGTSVLENEITCYTSVAQMLQPGDRVYLQQVQKKRHLLMNMGRSFMGVVKLSD